MGLNYNVLKIGVFVLDFVCLRFKLCYNEKRRNSIMLIVYNICASI